jgi:hypothetical protein
MYFVIVQITPDLLKIQAREIFFHTLLQFFPSIQSDTTITHSCAFIINRPYRKIKITAILIDLIGTSRIPHTLNSEELQYEKAY